MEFLPPLINKLSYKNVSFVMLALLTAAMGLYSFKNFSILMPLLTLVLIWYQGGIKNIHISPPFIFLFLLIVWSGLSVFWAYNFTEALKGFISLNLTVVFSVFFISAMTNASPELISKASGLLKLTGVFLILLVDFQAFINTFYVNNFFLMKPTGSILALTSFVGCGFVWINTNKFISVFIFCLLAMIVYLTGCETAFYGLILATFVFILSYGMPLWTTRFAMVSSFVILMVSPLFFATLLPPSAAAHLSYASKVLNHSLFHRFLAWEVFSKKFLERPFFGWGFESSRYIDMQSPVASLSPENNVFQEYLNVGKVLHPHNNSVQVFVELGMVGGLLYAAFFASLFWLVEKHVKDRMSIAVCNATLAFGFIAAEITHNVWRNYWLALVTLTAGAIILFIKAREEQLRVEACH